jgi:hypothetical protein
MAQVRVKGQQQPKDLPDSAKEVQDEFGLNFSAQPEAETAQSLLNTFLDSVSLTMTLMGAPVDKAGVFGGLSDVVLDILKTLHYSFDEQIIPFTDYRSSYVISGGVGPVTLSGTVDDIEQPFAVHVSTPEGETTATFDPADHQVTGSMTWHGVKLTTKGDFAPLTETKTGYTSEGMLFTCIAEAHQCSPLGNATLILTQQD